MASQHNSGTHAKFQALVNTLTTALGTDFDFSYAKGYRITLEVAEDGQSIAITTKQANGPSNSFGTAGGNGHLQRASAKTIRGSSMP